MINHHVIQGLYEAFEEQLPETLSVNQMEWTEKCFFLGAGYLMNTLVVMLADTTPETFAKNVETFLDMRKELDQKLGWDEAECEDCGHTYKIYDEEAADDPGND